MFADVLGVLAHHRRVVDGQHHVALPQSGFLCRGVGVRLVNDHGALLQVVAYECAYATVAPGHECLQVFLLGEELGVGVERAQHARNARRHRALRVEGVDVEQVEVAVEVVEDVETLGGLHVVVLSGLCLCPDGEELGERENQDGSHRP